MKRGGFNEEQILGVLKNHERDVTVADLRSPVRPLCELSGISG
jgi:hypothetical protein